MEGFTIKKTIFITFSGGRTGWKSAAKRICLEAEESGLFHSIHSLDEDWWSTWDSQIYRVGMELRNNFGPKGFGFWTWKASILNWAHINFPHHQILYVDAGTQITKKPHLLGVLSDLLETSWEENGLAWALPDHFEWQWSKKELLIAADLNPKDQKSNQIQGGFIALPPSSDRAAFVSQYRSWALRENGFFFSGQEHFAQESDFIEHRYDQSVLSCLWKKFGKIEHVDITDPINLNASPIIAFRNNSGLTLPAPKALRNFHLTKNLLADKLMGLQ